MVAQSKLEKHSFFYVSDKSGVKFFVLDGGSRDSDTRPRSRSMSALDVPSPVFSPITGEPQGRMFALETPSPVFSPTTRSAPETPSPASSPTAMSAPDTPSSDFSPITRRPQRRSTRVEFSDWTSIVVKNLPPSFNIARLLTALDEGFQGRYNAAYLPWKFKANRIFGYAKVDFVSHEDADRFKNEFRSFAIWGPDHEVHWGDIHGKDEWLREYQNSDIMHPRVPNEMKPLLFEDGVQVNFPLPTKAIEMPRDFKRVLRALRETERP